MSDNHDQEISRSASDQVEPRSEEESMTSNIPVSTPLARAVGSSETTIERHTAEVLKVSTRSRPSAVAGAIAGVIRDSGMAEVQSIGAGATNQAIKPVAIARSYLS